MIQVTQNLQMIVIMVTVVELYTNVQVIIMYVTKTLIHQIKSQRVHQILKVHVLVLFHLIYQTMIVTKFLKTVKTLVKPVMDFQIIVYHLIVVIQLMIHLGIVVLVTMTHQITQSLFVQTIVTSQIFSRMTVVIVFGLVVVII